MQRTIPATHPSLDGHFPGNPVVPGAVILEEVCLAIKEWQPGYRIQTLPSVKFLKPLKPSCTFWIDLIQSAPDKIGFTYRVSNEVYGSGTIILQPLRGTG